MPLFDRTGGRITKELETERLMEAPLLMHEFGSGSRKVVENALVQAGGLRRKDLKTRMELDSTEGLLSAVEAGLGVTFVSRGAVRNQLTLGTLKLARVRGVTFSRMFSLAYPAGPEPTGNTAAFRFFLLNHSLDLAPRVTGRAMKNPTEPEDSRARSTILTLVSDARSHHPAKKRKRLD